MGVLARLDPKQRERVETRLRSNLTAWLTTVRPDGQPRTVPVWFLWRDDETVLLYSQPNKAKLRNIQANPHVTLALDGCDLGRDIVCLDGTAQYLPDHPAPLDVPRYTAKYAERIGATFGTPERFARQFTEPVVLTPTGIHA